MDTSPTLSIGGSRARAALLTTSGSGTGSTDRRVVFLASQPAVGGSHETKTWPHHWSPHAVCPLILPYSFSALFLIFLLNFSRTGWWIPFVPCCLFILTTRNIRQIRRARSGREGLLEKRQDIGKNNRVWGEAMVINLKMFKRFRGN